MPAAGKSAEKVEHYVTPIVSHRPRNPVMVPTADEAKALREAMSANSKATMAALRTLPDEDRKAFHAVYDAMAQRPDGQLALQQLLLDGKLSWGSMKEGKRNLMQALGDIARNKNLDSGIEHRKTAFLAQLTQELAEWADVVVTMGCGDACPYIPGKRYLDWELPDPKGQEIDAVRATRDEIERRVTALLTEL